MEQYKIHFLSQISLINFEEQLFIFLKCLNFRYFQKAFDYSIRIILDNNLSLIKLRYFKDEILVLFDCIIQGFFLFKHNSTYAEYFFGFRRVHTKLFNSQEISSIAKQSILLTLTFKIFIPYLAKKLENFVLQQKELRNIQQDNSSYVGILQKIINVIIQLTHLSLDQGYKFLYTIYKTINFIYIFRYLFDPKQIYFSFLQKLVDHFIISVDSTQDKGNTKYNSNIFQKIIQQVSKNLIFILFMSIKLVEAYYKKKLIKISDKQISNVNIEPPFQSIDQAEEKGICKLCYQIIKQPTALDTVGYVFCYQCIYQYVNKNKKCPFTDIKCDMENLHRIFEQSQ